MLSSQKCNENHLNGCKKSLGKKPNPQRLFILLFIYKLQSITLRTSGLQTTNLGEHSLGLELPLFLPHILWTWHALTHSKIWCGFVQINKPYVPSYVTEMQLKDNRLTINVPKMYLVISTTIANRNLKKLSPSFLTRLVFPFG